jgi:ABC-type dipeptide/oligopeptide/nickel transport system permease component
MDSTIDAVVEIFSWVGFGLGAFVAGMALIMYLFDGTWLPTRGVLEDTEHGRIVRWFDEDGGVNEAHLSHEQEKALAGKQMADIFYRRGGRGRMRLTQASPAVRAIALLSLGLIGVGVVALIASLVLLFTRG